MGKLLSHRIRRRYQVPRRGKRMMSLNKSADYTIDATTDDRIREIRVTGTDKTITLPTAASCGKGFSVTVMISAPSSVTGATIAVDAGDTIKRVKKIGGGGGLVSKSAGQSLVNTAATDKAGDYVRLVSDGATTWNCKGQRGIWA